MWGLFPLYWPHLLPAGALEILAHRIVWSLVATVAMLAVRRQWSWVGLLARQPRKLLLLAVAAVLVSLNWGIYIYAVNNREVVETALGYFINPLVSVLFGVLILRERLRPGQWIAVGVAVVAVILLTVAYGRLPWIALLLATSFGTYGLIKKTLRLDPVESLTVETLVLFLPALGYLVYLHARGLGSFGHQGAAHLLLLIGGGPITALPLLYFGAAAIRVPLTVLGVLQYIAPTLQFLCGVAITHEPMPQSRWIGFSIIWLALAIFTGDALRAAGQARRVGARRLPDQPSV
jgi:chloramphenicol-sensitive protein RarD